MPTILVADDNANTQKMVSLAFEEQGIAVVAVGNGEAAVRKLPDLMPDIVLADVFMPVRNGYEVCEFVKKDPRFSKVPVILLVGAFDPLDENEARRVGADGILKKPFVPPDPMIAMVTSALEKVMKPEAAPRAAVPFSEVAPPTPKPAPPPVPVAVQEDAAATEEQLYAYGTGRRDLDEEDGAKPTSDAPGFREQVEEEERESRYHEQDENWHRPNARDLSKAELATSTTFEPAVPEPELASAPLVPTDEVMPGQEVDEKQEEHISAAVPPPARSETPSAPTEWMEMMAPAPPAEHPVAWSVPEASVEGEPESVETSAEAPTAKEEFFVPPEPHDWPPAPESITTAQEERGSEPPKATEFPVPIASVEAEVEKAAPYPLIETSAAPSASFEPAQVEQTSPAPAELEAAPVEDAPPSIPEPSESFDSAGSTAAESKGVESSTVDAVVERVMQRLGPRLQDFLASGVLRPIVEEALQKESEKKK